MALTTSPPSWQTCHDGNCQGVQYADNVHCLAHVPPELQRAAVEELQSAKQWDWGRGVPIDHALMQLIIEAAPSDESEHYHRTFPAVNFSRAIFETPAAFGFSRFTGNADFSLVHFKAGAEFGGAKFDAHCIFRGAQVSEGRVFFKAVEIAQTGDFHDTDFDGESTGFNLDSAHTLDFSNARFRTTTLLQGIFADANFDHCVFEGPTSFSIGQSYQRREEYFDRGRVQIHDAVFWSPSDLGWIVTKDEVDLSRTRFEAGFDLKVLAPIIRFTRIRTVAGARVEFAGDMELSDAEVSGSTLLTSLRSQPDGSQPDVASRIVSMRRSAVDGLTVSDIDLRVCRFADAHRLDGLRIERCELPETPRTWYTNERGNRILCTRRQTILEEHLWRSALPRVGTAWQEPAELAALPAEGGSPTPSAQQVAATYRALRKGKEDTRDAPGGGDFYYGEMEMRRLGGRGGHSGSRTDPIERAVVSFYWLIAGYGLRGSRALVTLAITIAIGGAGLHWFGFDRGDRMPYGRSTLFALESSFGLLRPPEATLTVGGDLIQIALRVAGPLLVGLALLSIRGRVKR